MNRQIHIDSVAGVMIATMIVLHISGFCGVYEDIGRHVISATSFFMMWFFYKSGMFSNDNVTIHDITKKGIKKLICPFVIYSILCYILYIIIKDEPLTAFYPKVILYQLLYKGGLSAGEHLWFLPILFTCQLLICIFLRYRRTVLMSSFFVFLLLNNMHNENLPLFMLNLPLGLFYYCIGRELKDRQYNMSFFVASVIVYPYLLSLQNISIDARTGHVSPLLRGLLFGIVGSVVFNNIFKRINALSLQLPYLTFIGKNAMSLYVIHYPLLFIANHYLTLQHTNLYIKLAVNVTLAFVLLPILVSIYKKCKLNILNT